ncbi:MAG: ABC-F family ATP-binding cassette domain-containing protein [Bacillota bacterium]
MSLITAQGLQKFYAANPILLDVDLAMALGERVGLIGRNGTGKTTLLRILAGLEEADAGSINWANGVTRGYLTQDVELPLEDTVWSAVSAALGQVMELEQRMRRLEQTMGDADVLAEPKRLQQIMGQYERIAAEFERLEGYDCDVKVRTTLNGLGLPEAVWQQPVGLLSGGQRTRAALAHLLLLQPQVLLLDEPTNHLDMEAISWLENHLLGYSGALLVVSHDREFLDRVANKIWEIERHQLVKYVGNYSSYLTQKAEHGKRQELLHRQQQEEREHLTRLIAKFKYGTRATMAKSWEKRLQKMQPVQRQVRQKRMRLSAEAQRRSGNDVLQVNRLSKSFPGQQLFRDFSAEVKLGEKIALVGPNGAGKTTLLRVLLGQLPADAGSYRWGASIDLGYFSQELKLPRDDVSVLDCLLEGTKLQPADGRSWLARFLFTGESVHSLVATLSGGERNRLILAKLLLSKANVLVLDEPTNHLDIPARESLENALHNYNGTLFIVSHDRYFIKQVATRIWHLEQGEIRDFRGGYVAYEAALQAVSQKKDEANTRVRTKQPSTPRTVAPISPERTLEQLEEEIGLLESEQQHLTQLLADAKTYQGDDAAQVVARFHAVEKQLGELYTEWERMAAKVSGP